MNLREIKSVRQNKGEDFRRWFQDDYFDLIVWYDDDKKISGFELCYDRLCDEHVFLWRYDSGFSHYRIDDGESVPDTNMTPILVPDGAFPFQLVAKKYKDQCADVDKEINKIVMKKLKEFQKPKKKRKKRN